MPSLIKLCHCQSYKNNKKAVSRTIYSKKGEIFNHFIPHIQTFNQKSAARF